MRPKVVAPELPLARVRAALAAAADAAATAARALCLVLLFTPVVATAALLRLVAPMLPARALAAARRSWARLLRGTLGAAGPAFIKWGQWAATRGDLFPPHVTFALRALQSGAPAHGASVTVAAVEAALGARLADAFSFFDPAPVASGAVAQVHKAILSPAGAAAAGARAGDVVAVKVRHPKAADRLARDFAIMLAVAALASKLPALAGLEDTVRPFGAPLRDQLDLSMEAVNLRRFRRNFARCASVSFPVPHLATPDVLIESFEEGVPISEYVWAEERDGKGGAATTAAPSPLRAALAAIGLGAYLQMLVRDNFVHADLHPGNLLVARGGPRPGSTPGLAARARTLLGLPAAAAPPKIIVLDVGMVAELAPADAASLASFFRALSDRDGAKVGGAALRLASGPPPTPAAAAAFTAEMGALFNGLTADEVRERTQEVFGAVLDTLRRHSVAVSGSVATVVASALVLEGWSTALDPEIRVVDRLKELLPAEWHERWIARWGEQVAGSPTPMHGQ